MVFQGDIFCLSELAGNNALQTLIIGRFLTVGSRDQVTCTLLPYRQWDSSSLLGSVEENFAGFLPENVCFLRACFRGKFYLLWYFQLA
jgi:hypothetical protein